MKKLSAFILLLVIIFIISLVYKNNIIDYFDNSFAESDIKNTSAYPGNPIHDISKFVDKNNFTKTQNNKSYNNVFRDYKNLNTKTCASDFTNDPYQKDPLYDIPDSCIQKPDYLNRSYAYGQRQSNNLPQDILQDDNLEPKASSIENFDVTEMNQLLLPDQSLTTGNTNSLTIDDSSQLMNGPALVNNKKMSEEDKFNSKYLLPPKPSDGDSGFDDIPYIMSDFDAALANSTRHIGVDTIGTSRRGMSTDLRGDPFPIVKFMTGPWNQSSIDQKIVTKNLSCII